MANEYLDAIEKSIQQAKICIEAGNALKKLKDNREFNAIVLKGYFEDEAIRLVHLKADPNMQKQSMQEDIIKQIDAIGAFGNYMTTVLFRADMSLKSIEADEQAKEDILFDDVTGVTE